MDESLCSLICCGPTVSTDHDSSHIRVGAQGSPTNYDRRCILTFLRGSFEFHISEPIYLYPYWMLLASDPNQNGACCTLVEESAIIILVARRFAQELKTKALSVLFAGIKWPSAIEQRNDHLAGAVSLGRSDKDAVAGAHDIADVVDRLAALHRVLGCTLTVQERCG